MAFEFAVDDVNGHLSNIRQHTFDTFGEACAFAVGLAASHGEAVNVDVLAYSEADAKAWGGDTAVESYREGLDASVLERIVVKAESVGRIA